MPKPEHLGHKLARAIAAKDVTQAEVARVFGVSRPTVSSDWLKEGRIAKKHYPLLVSYFGLPYEYWFGEAGADPDIRAVLLAMIGMTREDRRTLARHVATPGQRLAYGFVPASGPKRQKKIA